MWVRDIRRSQRSADDTGRKQTFQCLVNRKESYLQYLSSRKQLHTYLLKCLYSPQYNKPFEVIIMLRTLYILFLSFKTNTLVIHAQIIHTELSVSGFKPTCSWHQCGHHFLLTHTSSSYYILSKLNKYIGVYTHVHACTLDIQDILFITPSQYPGILKSLVVSVFNVLSGFKSCIGSFSPQGCTKVAIY